MLCYVRELGDSHIGKVYSQGVTDGKREHNIYIMTNYKPLAHCTEMKQFI